MPKIETISLRCLNPEAQRQFCVKVLGMRLREDGAVSYRPEQAGLLFQTAEQAYRPTPNDVYWKIAIAVPNIELACEELAAEGIGVSAPNQFRDVGYLAHFRDPEGFTIELIDHWFKGNRPAIQGDATSLSDCACLNLLTLRTHDIAPLRRMCLGWGMTPLSIQRVEPYGFTLHFFAFTDETPPSDDLMAVENRQWLYQRPYSILEIQELHGADPMTDTPDAAAGYAGTYVLGLGEVIGDNALGINSEPNFPATRN